MSIARGSKSAVRFIPESTYGTRPGGNWYETPFLSESIGGTINEIISNEIRSDRSVPAVRGGNISSSGALNYDFSLVRFGIFLQHLFGRAFTTTTIATPDAADLTAYNRGDIVQVGANDYLCVTGGTTDDVSVDLVSTATNQILTSGDAEFVFAGTALTNKYQHTLTSSSDFLTGGISLEKAILGGDDNFFAVFSGGRIGSLDVTIPQEGIVQSVWNMTFSEKITRPNATVAGTPVILSDDPVTGFEAAVAINDVVSTVLKEASFKVDNMLEPEHVVGRRTVEEIVPKRLEMSGNVTMLFRNVDDYDRFLNEETFSLTFSFYRGSNFLSIKFPEVKMFGDPTPKIASTGAVTLAFTWRAFKQNETDYPRLTLKNRTASYVS